MPQHLRPAAFFLWLVCLATSVSASQLELRCEIGDRFYPVAKVERTQAFVLIDGKLTKVPRDAKWRIDGDLRDNAQLADWSPGYSLMHRDTPDWEVDKLKEPYRVSVQIVHFTERKGKSMPSPFLGNWPEGLPTAGLVVIAWVQDGRVTKARAVPVPSTMQAKFFTVREEMDLLVSETEGQPVTLLWCDGVFRPASARFAEPAAQAAFIAAELGDTVALQTALKAGLDPASVDRDGKSLLHYAAEAGHLGAVNTLLAAGAKPNGKKADDSTPLHWAVKGHRVEVVERLLAAGAEKDAGLRRKDTPLGDALRSRFNDVALILVAAKVDLTEEDRLGRTPWAVAVDCGMADVAAAIAARRGVRNTDEDQQSRVLITQASQGHTAVVKILLKEGAQPNVEAHGRTALVAGAESGDPELAKTLIAAGARPGDAVASGITPLMAAATYGRAAYAQVLLRAGADANVALEDGNTALHMAAGARAGAVVDALLARGANPLKPNKRGLNPLQTALYARARGPADAMVARGASLSLKGAETAELLEIAITIDAAGVIRQALADGWSPDTEFRGGWPALLVANECKAEGCVELLRAAGAKEVAGPEIPMVVNARELDTRLAIASAVNPYDPRDFADDFPSATVAIDVVVDRSGEVRFPHVLGAPEAILTSSALAAIARWKFTPPLRKQTPVATKARVPLVFASSHELARELFEIDTLPEPVKRVAPIYPMELRRKNITGDVTLRFVVNAAGRTEHLRVTLSQHPDLDAAAVEAVRQWVFKPGLLDGKPVATWMEQPITFRLQ